MIYFLFLFKELFYSSNFNLFTIKIFTTFIFKKILKRNKISYLHSIYFILVFIQLFIVILFFHLLLALLSLFLQQCIISIIFQQFVNLSLYTIPTSSFFLMLLQIFEFFKASLLFFQLSSISILFLLLNFFHLCFFSFCNSRRNYSFLLQF